MKIYDACNPKTLGRQIEYAIKLAKESKCTHVKFNGQLIKIKLKGE